MFDFTDKVVVITGGANGIGRCLCEQFARAGAHICTIDRVDNPYFVGDLAQEATLQAFADKVLADYGRVDVLIHNAPPAMHGIGDCTYGQFMQALAVGVSAPFFLTQCFRKHFGANASVIHISSTRDRMSQGETESYTAAKGAITALTHALASSLEGIARVNAICPGWIDTTGSVFVDGDALQHTVGRVGKPLDVAYLALFLASEGAGFINGQDICVDGGMTKRMIYHGDAGWQYTPTQTQTATPVPAELPAPAKIDLPARPPLGKYRHFKGNEYELIGFAKHSESMEDMVVYRPLYGEGNLWVRPASMWTELVTREGKTFPRFAYLGEM